MNSTCASAKGKSWAGQIASRVRDLRARACQPRVQKAATICILDYFAVALAALRDPLAGLLARSLGQVGKSPQATALAGGFQTAAPIAAMQNGALAHILDYDDTIWTYIGHSTATIFPAALAMAENLDRNGEELLSAFALGVETAHILGSSVTPALGERGWHPSPVIGVFGAAAACGLLYDAEEGELARALTLCTNLAAGIKQNFGSAAKPLVVGWSAHAGTMAALLAKGGLGGANDALEGRQGFYAAYAGEIPRMPSAKKSRSLAIVTPGVGFKLYPCCTGTHPAIEAVLGIRRREEFDPQKVALVEAEVTPEVLNELIYPRPLTPAQAKFSLPYCVALALIFQKVGLEHFADHYLKNPLVQRLMKRVRVRPNDQLTRLGGAQCPASRVVISLESGERFAETVSVAKGNPGNPISLEEMKEKFRQCAAWAKLPDVQTEALLKEILAIGTIKSIATWMKKRVAPVFRKVSPPKS